MLLKEVLQRARVEHIAEKLAVLGVEEPQDLLELDDEDRETLNLKKIHAKRFEKELEALKSAATPHQATPQVTPPQEPREVDNRDISTNSPCPTSPLGYDHIGAAQDIFHRCYSQAMKEQLWAHTWSVAHRYSIDHRFLPQYTARAARVFNVILNGRSSNAHLCGLLHKDMVETQAFVTPILINILSSGPVANSFEEWPPSYSDKHMGFQTKLKCQIKDHLFKCHHVVKGMVQQNESWVEHGARVGAAFSQGAAVLNESVVRPAKRERDKRAARMFLGEFGLSGSSSDEDVHAMIERASTEVAELFTKRFHSLVHQLAVSSVSTLALITFARLRRGLEKYPGMVTGAPWPHALFR